MNRELDLEDALDRLRMKEAEHPDEGMIGLIIMVADEMNVDENDIVDAMMDRLRQGLVERNERETKT